MLEIRQRSEKEKQWKRNDRFFAVATHAHDHGGLKTWTTLRPHMLDEIEAFFAHYASLNGKPLEVVLARKGPRRALKLLKAGAKTSKNSR